MPKVRASSGTMGTMRRPSPGSRSSLARTRTSTMVVEARRPRLPWWNSSKSPSAGGGEGAAVSERSGHEPAQGPPPLQQVADLGAVLRRPVEGQLLHLLVGEGDVEAGAHLPHHLHVEPLELVGRHRPLADAAHAEALDRLGQHHRRAPRQSTAARRAAWTFSGSWPPRRMVRMCSSVRPSESLIRRSSPPKKCWRWVLARGDRVLLVLAVHQLAHAAGDEPLRVAGQQRVPVGAPDHLDHVPLGAAEDGLQLLDDLGVAAHRAVERCRLQLMTKTRLSRRSREAREIAPGPLARPSRRRRGRPRPWRRRAP